MLSNKAIILFAISCLVTWCCMSQPAGWHQLDFKEDRYYGISLEKAYSLLASRKADTVIIAIIDTGIDTTHVDLKANLWHNNREDGKDADKNGYRGDFVGWNFLGSKSGKNLLTGSYEYQRMYSELNTQFGKNFSRNIICEKFSDFSLWIKVRERFLVDSTILSIKFPKDLDKYLQDPNLERKTVIGDDYNDVNDRDYGNGNIMSGININHGTHVAGIIGASRDNGIGVKGIVGAVKLMIIRAVPKYDEYDKDIALAIRYAVDNGAKVVNMSFGKDYSPFKHLVNEAILYAAKKDVLIVRGAGNSATNIDLNTVYPCYNWDGSNISSNIITVAASGATLENLIPSFTNYGKKQVDVFAPGSNIYSTVYASNPDITSSDPGNKYNNMSGTSMAAPVVSGIAALLRSYYPDLKASEIKYIIEKSVTKITDPVIKPGTREKVFMSELCGAGGIVNAYSAVQFANKFAISNKKEIRKGFKIDGVVNGLPDGTALYLYQPSKRDTIAKAVSKNGHFSFTGIIDTPVEFCYIRPDSNVIKKSSSAILLDNIAIKIHGSMQNWPQLTIKGSELQLQYDNVVVTYRRFKGEIDILDERRKNISIQIVSIERTKDTLLLKLLKDSLNLIYANINSIRKLHLDSIINFIIKHKNSKYIPHLILSYEWDFGKERMRELYEILGQEAKDSHYGMQLRGWVKGGVLKVGMKVGEISGITPEGKSISVEEVLSKSEYLLLDFWASWCKPCRTENPSLRQAFQLYHDKGFNILSITSDTNLESWKKAINDDKMLWLHMIDREKNATISKMYHIQAIPAYFLLDKKGVVIAIDYPLNPDTENLKGNNLVKKLELLCDKK